MRTYSLHFNMKSLYIQNCTPIALSDLQIMYNSCSIAIDVLNHIGRADGKRSLWKTEKTEAK